jgi:hypothetical protein
MSTAENTKNQTLAAAAAVTIELEHLDLRSLDIVADKQEECCGYFPRRGQRAEQLTSIA